MVCSVEYLELSDTLSTVCVHVQGLRLHAIQFTRCNRYRCEQKLQYRCSLG